MIVKFDAFLISRILNTDFCIPVCVLGATKSQGNCDQLQRELIVKPTVWK